MALTAPLPEEHVIVAVPADFAVTVPSSATMATEVSLDDQLTVLLVALEGVTVAVSCDESPSVNVRLVLESVIFDTGIALTVTRQVALLP